VHGFLEAWEQLEADRPTLRGARGERPGRLSVAMRATLHPAAPDPAAADANDLRDVGGEEE
jgi:hypothetical protein